MVGGDGLGEQADVRLAVAFGHVTEDLVVGAVLLDHVDDILDRRGIADLGGDQKWPGTWGGLRGPQADRATPERAALPS